MFRNFVRCAIFPLPAFVGFLVGFVPFAGHAGTSHAADYLDIPVDARALALGMNRVAAFEEASSAFANPANAVWGPTTQVQFSYGGLYGGLAAGLASHQGFFVRVPLRGRAGLAFSLVRFAVDGIPRYGDLSGGSFLERLEGFALLPDSAPEGYFSDNEIAVVGAFGRGFPLRVSLNWLVEKINLFPYVGVGFKVLHQSIDHFSAGGAGFDLGGGMEVDLRQFSDSPWLGQLNLAWTGRDVSNTVLTWSNKARQSRLFSSVWGISYRVKTAGGIAVSSTWQVLTGSEKAISVGMGVGYGGVDILIGFHAHQLGIALGAALGHVSVAYGVRNSAIGQTQRIEVGWSVR